MPALARTSVRPVGDVVALEHGCGPAVTSYSGLPSSVLASVDLPEPFGPMRACTSPAPTVRSTPRRISSVRLVRLGRPGVEVVDLEERVALVTDRHCNCTTAIVEM